MRLFIFPDSAPWGVHSLVQALWLLPLLALSHSSIITQGPLGRSAGSPKHEWACHVNKGLWEPGLCGASTPWEYEAVEEPLWGSSLLLSSLSLTPLPPALLTIPHPHSCPGVRLGEHVINAEGWVAGFLGPILGCGLILECALRSSDAPVLCCVRREED